jgi:hypothetical protein
MSLDTTQRVRVTEHAPVACASCGGQHIAELEALNHGQANYIRNLERTVQAKGQVKSR